ncbi:hypothetical protein [Pseudophaeobacter sp.]|uniref:Uncharacterized protein n=1 Tax=Pseudophaeobacter arcticus TaxID=385492 RepID=A0ABQ0ALB1_9RHOB
MSVQEIDHAEVARLGNEAASYSTMAMAFGQSGNTNSQRGADAACRSAFMQMGKELGYDVEGLTQ